MAPVCYAPQLSTTASKRKISKMSSEEDEARAMPTPPSSHRKRTKTLPVPAERQETVLTSEESDDEEDDDDDDTDEDEDQDQVPNIVASDVDSVVDHVPTLKITTDNDEPYTPDNAYEAVKTYADYLLGLVRRPDLGLPRQRTKVWAGEIKEVKARSMTQTTIAVIGATGAGKSSLINALLDQPDLLPANCVRACTATVVEVSYHDKDTFEADVKYLSWDEWREELSCLLQDLFETDGTLRTDDSEEFRVASAKIHAVYPNISPQTLLDCAKDEDLLDDLIGEDETAEILGEVKRVGHDSATQFSLTLAQYVESDDDVNLGGETTSEDGTRVSQLWPLVKCIECRVKAHALATGATLVDLPGCQDTNAARSAIAKDYMKHADVFYIVAPINRAVNDKVAHDLMGVNFRRQLLMDGSYNERAITFICSKADDVNAKEVMRSLRIQLSTDDHLRRVNDQMNELSQALRHHTRARTIVERVAKKPESSIKRVGTDRSRSSQNLGPSNQTPSQLPQASASTNIAQTENVPRGSEKQLGDLELNNEINRTTLSLRDSARQRDSICAIARNKHCKEILRIQFRKGLQEAEEAHAMRISPDSYDPGKSLRDYSGINLPVFCVSARDYLLIDGPEEAEPAVFSNKDETEIPQLQQHTRSLSDPDRRAAAHKALEDLRNITRGVNIYLATDGRECSADGATFRSNQDAEIDMLAKAWDHEASLKSALLRERLKEVIVSVIRQDVTLAIETAGRNLDAFAEHNRWNTYRATMVRKGMYRDDLNERLIEPMLKNAAGPWQRLFDQGVQEMFADLPELLRAKSEDALNSIDKHSSPGLKPRTQQVARQQSETMSAGFEDLTIHARRRIRELSKDIHRKLAIDIQRQLKETYGVAGVQRGKGCFKSMRRIVEEYVSENASPMFGYTADKTEARFDKLCDEVYDAMKEDLRKLETSLRFAYSGLWDGMTATADEIKLRQAVCARAGELAKILSRLADRSKTALISRTLGSK